MGIINVTPDSFYDGGKYLEISEALKEAEHQIKAGADILDIGGESTRPGAAEVEVAEEIRRTIPVIQAIRAAFPAIPISIDTRKAAVAEQALGAGADMVNDITALRGDQEMAHLVARRKVPVVLMHMQGTPQNMQLNPHYQDVVVEIIEFLQRSRDLAIYAGVLPEQVIIDPGIGFGKTLENNVEILRRLSEFEVLGHPILIGPSRKSMIGALLGGLSPADRLEGTIAACVVAVARGAHIVRVHDVLPVTRALRVADTLLKAAPRFEMAMSVK
jgi:dihydropteroate synthase